MNAERQREIWYDGREVPLARGDVWSLVNNSALRKIVVTREQRTSGHFPRKTEFVTEIRSPDDLNGFESADVAFAERPDLLAAAKGRSLRTCRSFRIDSGPALEEACREAEQHDYVVVDFDLPTNIPLELFIARLQGRRTVLLRRVSTVTEMEVAFGVLEEGSDGAVFTGTDLNRLLEIGPYLARAGVQTLALVPLVVQDIRHVGMGMRACVDTISLMARDEGMMVGSTSSGGILVCAETHYLPYMNLRPFRVNAGAVHSYIWTPDDRVEYLTDLSAGSRVLCVNTTGQARELTVGRMKIEARPLLLIVGEAAGVPVKIVIQDDWHIRLMGADRQPKNATVIRPGDELLAHVCPAGRHVGLKVEETIVER